MALKSDKSLVWLKGAVKTPPFGENPHRGRVSVEATTARGHAEPAPVETDARNWAAMP